MLCPIGQSNEKPPLQALAKWWEHVTIDLKNLLKMKSLRNIHLGATIVGIYRQDVYEIPPDAIRELIINAVVHRSYLDHGMIQVAVYDNRLEITSPGKLPMGQTLERMKEGYSRIRNEALAHAFSYMNLIEHWGSGIPRIIGKVKDAGLREPEFIGGEVDLRINIYRGQIESTVNLNNIMKMPDSTDKVPGSAGKCRESAGYRTRTRNLQICGETWFYYNDTGNGTS